MIYGIDVEQARTTSHATSPESVFVCGGYLILAAPNNRTHGLATGSQARVLTGEPLASTNGDIVGGSVGRNGNSLVSH